MTPHNLPPLPPDDAASPFVPLIAAALLFLVGFVIPAILRFFGIDV